MRVTLTHCCTPAVSVVPCCRNQWRASLLYVSFLLMGYGCGATCSFLLMGYGCGAACSFLLMGYGCGATCSFLLMGVRVWGRLFVLINGVRVWGRLFVLINGVRVWGHLFLWHRHHFQQSACYQHKTVPVLMWRNCATVPRILHDILHSYPPTWLIILVLQSGWIRRIRGPRALV